MYLQHYVSFLLCFTKLTALKVNVGRTKVWGPGLQPHIITMPARYFFIQAVDDNNSSIVTDLGGAAFNVNLDGESKSGKQCRIWLNILNRKDGSYIVRYKLYEPCSNLRINILYENNHVAGSPYSITETIYPDDCDCSTKTVDEFVRDWQCGQVPQQVQDDLMPFKAIDWDQMRDKVIKKFDQPLSVSLCHYIIKNNAIYRHCYGKYVGFKMFMDNTLLSLSRKLKLPDVEFFVNLGDWPLITDDLDVFPILSWCGSTTSKDIVMPTYDITESSLENMGRVMLDMLSVQGNVKGPWESRSPQAFWRGRDSNQHRLDLIDISRQHPHLFNVSLTNFFFFRDKLDQYGPKTDHVSFFDFFNYKYQVSIDGTVAAYRFPYLLAGGSLIFKQHSKYYEHFYNQLEPNVHYIPIKTDLSDLVAKLSWAGDNDKEAFTVARNGQLFANNYLLPQHIFCYYVHLLKEFASRIPSVVRVMDGMERLEQIKQNTLCDCQHDIKDEL